VTAVGRAAARRAAPAEATYVYGVVAGDRAPALGRALRGLPGTGPPRAVDAGEGLWLVVGSAPLPAFSSEAIERGLEDLDWVARCAVAHEAVLERLLAASAAVVPMKLFTLFAGDERAVSQVRRTRRRIARVVERIAGCAEWGIRIGAATGGAAAPAAGRRPASGSAYLAAKVRQREAARDRERAAREESARVLEEVGAAAREVRAIERPPVAGEPRPALEAVCLVEARGRRRFLALAARVERRLKARGLRFELTGPWPPYHFVEGA
jgi:hypothetical protein